MNPVTPLSRLSKLLYPHRQEITSIYFYAILSGLVQLSLPLGVQAIIGFVLGASMVTSIFVLILLVVTGTFLVGVFQMNQMKIIEKIQQSIFTYNAFSFAYKIPKISLLKTDNYFLPEKINRFFDTVNVQKGLAKVFIDLPLATIQIVFGLVLLSMYHPLFIWFGFLLLVVLGLILNFTGKKGLRSSLEESTYKYAVVAWLEEMAGVIQSLKFSREKTLYLSKTDHNVVGYLKARTAHFNVLLFQYKILITFKVLITTGMLVVGTYLLIDQQLNIGEFIAAEIVILMVIGAIEKIIGNLDSVYDVVTGLEKLASVTESPEEKGGSLRFGQDAGAISIEINDLAFHYPDGRPVLKGLNLSIPASTSVCITGHEGSGKSTLLKILCGLYTDFKGTVLLNQFPLDHFEPENLRRRLGIFLSQQDIFSGTVLENISMGDPKITPEVIVSVAEACGLIDFIYLLPEGLQTEIDAAGKKLPGSIIKQILLLRALSGRPGLLLLEDPWSGLETSLKQSIIRYLLQLKDTTLIVVSNDEHFARECRYQLVLQPGTFQFNQNQ